MSSADIFIPRKRKLYKEKKSRKQIYKQSLYNLPCPVYLILNLCIENTRLTYYQKNRDIILKKARDKQNKPKEKIKKIMYEKNKYCNMTEEQKNKRREYERNRNCIMTEEEKNRRR